METTTSKIIRGDCLEIMKKIPDQSIDFICSDFPYNISGKGKITFTKGKATFVNFGKWDRRKKNEYENFVFEVCLEYKRILKPNASLVLFFDYCNAGWLAKELEDRSIFSFKNPIIFEKENPWPHVKQNGFRSCFEMSVWLVNNQDTGDHRPRTLHFLSQEEMKNVMSYRLGNNYDKPWHPNEKPEHLIKRLILIFTDPDDLVLDSFAGGGTTPAACQKTGRRFLAIEKETGYFQMMKERLNL